MPQYRTEIVFSTNDSREQTELVQMYDGIQNGMRLLGNITILIQGNKFTFTITRHDPALTPEEAEFEILLDIYQYFYDVLNPIEEPEDPLDMAFWEFRDIDVAYYLVNVETEEIV